MITLILSLCAILLILCAVIVVRNPWVYDRRMEFVDKYCIKDPDYYHSLPIYNKMMYKFWIWDISKFDKKATK